MLIAVVMSIVIAWMLDYSQYRITWKNYQTRFNGYGSIPDVLKGVALAPMQYRVFVPWSFWVLNRAIRSKPLCYEVIKILFMALGLFSMWLMLNTLWDSQLAYVGLLLTAVFYTVQFQFDYTEQYVELAIWAQFVTAVFMGDVGWMIACIVIGALTRETVVFLPVLYLFAKQDIVLFTAFCLLVVFVFFVLRMLYGWKENYLKKGVIIGKEYFSGYNHTFKNIKDIKEGLNWPLHTTWYSMLLVILSFIAICYNSFPQSIAYCVYVVIPFVAVWFCRAMFHETRVGLQLVVFIIPMIGRLLYAY